MAAWVDAFQAAMAAIAKKQWSQALREAEPWLTRVRPKLDGADWADALKLLAVTAAGAVDRKVQAPAESAAAAPDDPHVLYDLGHALVEVRRPGLAVALLARAVERSAVKGGALAELAAALELQGRNRDVLELLDGHAAVVDGDPLLSYLRGFNAVMVGDLDGARRVVPAVGAADDERLRFMAARLERVLARADGLRARGRLGADDLRGWHFVITGGVLVHDRRLDKTWDSAARVRSTLGDVALVVDALGLDLPVLLYPPERNCELVARALSSILDRRVKKWVGGGERGLVVVYDARDLVPDLRKALVHHRPGQPLYMRAAEHTTEQPTAPDVLGYLYARNTSPWGPGFTPDLKLIDTSMVDDGELVAAILAADDSADRADPAALRDFVALVGGLAGDAAPAARRDSGQRERLWVGSPVART